MKKIVMYVEPDWAFGSVHYELMKRLYQYGFDCQLLSWNQGYSVEELIELDYNTDIWLTTPHGYRYLKYVYDAIEPERCVVVAHASIDIDELKFYNCLDDFNRFKSYGVVSEFLKFHSINSGIARIPVSCPVGINFNNFYSKPSEELKIIGFAGAYRDPSDTITTSITDVYDLFKIHLSKKRGYLVEQCASTVNLEYKIANAYHHSYVTMGGFYKSVDCVIIPSSEEGAGLPALEAGAAGKLVIGAEVGHWKQRIGDKGGVIVPIDEQSFKSQTTEILNFYKNNPSSYRKKCSEIQEHARTYDWEHVIHHWINILNTQ